MSDNIIISRFEKILLKFAGEDIEIEEPQSRIEELLLRIIQNGSISKNKTLFGSNLPDNDDGEDGSIYLQTELIELDDSGLGWYAKAGSICKDTNTIGTIRGRRYYKDRNDPAIVVFFPISGYYQARYVSTVADACLNRTSDGGATGYHYSYSIDGITWYFSKGNYGFSTSIDSIISDYPKLETGFDFSTQEGAESFLKEMGVTYSNEEKNKIIDIYVKISGVWEKLFDSFLEDIDDSIGRIIPTDTLNIDSNGVYDVINYANVIVSILNSLSAGDEGKVVSNGALVAQGSQTITENGIYDTTLNDEVTVNVSGGSGGDGFSPSDEGKVVSNGSLVAQTSLAVTENGTYDTTLNNEVSVNVAGSGGITYEETPINKYAINYTPASNASGATSGGFVFTTSVKIKVSKIRVFARGTTASGYINQGDTVLASVIDATVVDGQWNDLTLSEPIYLEPNTTYLVWYSLNGMSLKYTQSTLTPNVECITKGTTYYSTSANTKPSNSESVTTYGVDFYVDAMYTPREVELITKSITANGTYNASDDDADGYSSVTVNVSGGSGEGVIIAPIIPMMTSNTAPSGVASASSILNVNFDAFKAFDLVKAQSNMQGGWLASESDNAPWLQYEFDEATQLYEIDIYTANNSTTATRTVEIEGRKNGAWENALKTGSNVSLTFTNGTYGDSSVRHKILLNLETYDAIRIKGNERFYLGANQTACTFSEVYVFGVIEGHISGGGSTNILSGTSVPSSSDGSNGAIYLQLSGLLQKLVTQQSELNVTVTANTNWPRYEPWKAFTSSSGWVGSGGNPHWLQIEFPTEIGLSEVKFVSGDSNRSHAISRIGYSNDGTTFTDATISETTMVNNVGHAVLDQIYTAKYFRLYFDGDYTSSTYPIISSLELYGLGHTISDVFCKVNGTWQELIGSDIDDVDTGV